MILDMKKVIIKVIQNGDGIEEILELIFNNHELELLDLFQENFKRLKLAKLLENDRVPIFKGFSCSEEKGLDFLFSDFEYQNVYELLHLIRPFILDTEPASFKKVCSIFGKKARGSLLAPALKNIRFLYEKGEYQPLFQMSITINNSEEELKDCLDNIYLGIESNQEKERRVNLFEEETFKAWLNGMEYHQDKDKRLIIKNLEKSLGENVTKRIFASQLSGKIKAIYALSDLAQLDSA